jgi:chemosensory pili system protein ChpA (sensor histidine kinase/response regulator)
VSPSAADNLEIFSQTAFEQLQFLREYAGVLLDPCPSPAAIDQLFQSAQVLADNTLQYGLPLFSEISGKLAHLFHYALTTTISPDSCGPIVDFVYEAVALLESDLLHVSTNHGEAADDIEAFKQKYPFAFQGAAAEQTAGPESPANGEGRQTGAPGQSLAAAPAEEVPAEIQSMLELPPEDSDLPAEILEFFVPEAEEHLQAVTECLLSLEADPEPSSEEIHRLFRALHTLKGSAAQVGLQRFAHVAHSAEDLIGRLRDGELRPTASIVDICLEVVDVLKKFLYHQWPDETTIRSSVQALLTNIACQLSPELNRRLQGGRITAVPGAAPAPARESTGAAYEAAGGYSQPEESATAEAPEGTWSEASIMPAPGAGSLPAPPKDLARAGQSKSVRVPLDRLDRMMNVVGELVINRTRMLGRMGDLERLAEVLNFSKGRLIDKIAEFQDRYEFTHLNSSFGRNPGMAFWEDRSPQLLREPTLLGSGQSEFSDLEWDRYDDFNILARSLTEISADLTEVLSQLGRFVRQVDSELDEFTNLAHRLQDEITEARMVPIGNLYTRLSRTARDSAKAAGKVVELVFSGGETDLDNGIIQQISDPLIHLLRNAVAHGIESPEERMECGKPPQGRVAVQARQQGNQIRVEVEDDGRGIDYENVRATALSQGIVTAEEAGRLTQRELLQYLFRPGFSTASRKTELAGRGVGLDIVRTNLASLNGEISVDTEPGIGTRFTLQVPLTLIITQALFLRHGEWTFGIPLACVEEIRRLRVSDIEVSGGKLLTRVRDQVTEVIRLDSRLALPPVEPINGYYRMVIVNVGGRQVGIVVEEVLRKDEIVIKGLGEYLHNVRLFSGATIAPDGMPILLIDVGRLVAGEAAEQSLISTGTGAIHATAQRIPPAMRMRQKGDKVILLADDSISVRRFVGRMLDKAGYQVRFASDGLEALEAATASPCSLVLTDLEMPRTNGYELMAHLRQNPSTRRIPVVVLTSRVGAKHRDKAFKDGAVAFLTKPVREEELLSVVGKILGRENPGAPRTPGGIEKNS